MKIIVVGSGFSGSIIAREIAEELDVDVVVVESRNHIAGNMYDEYDEHGILIHKYGPHVVVTNYWDIIKYLMKFSDMYKHVVKEISFIDGQYVRLPYNFESIQQLIGEEKAEVLINKLRKEFAGRDRVPVIEIADSKDEDIAAFGHLLFEKSYRTYCSKFWDIPVDQLDTSIMNRVPMAMNYDERYMNKDFQFLPADGYTKLFENMLKHPRITVRLNENANDHLKFESDEIFYDDEKVDILVYTGAIDEMFGVKYGELPYRSLDIKYEWFDKDRIYPEEIVSYPQAAGYTRRTEYKFLMKDKDKCSGTTIATEYPIAYKKGQQISPFYPVITQETKERYQKYLNDAGAYKNLFLCGRLAEFKYYNMDDCIMRAFSVANSIKEYIKNKKTRVGIE